MIRILRTTAAVAAALAVAAPASASVTINFGGGNSATDGSDGNVRNFSGGGVNVKASGWSYDDGVLEQAWLGDYSNGLGVTNDNEGNGTSSNSHTVDNIGYGQKDFVLLVFDQAVNIESAVLVPYNISSTNDDNDAWVSFANLLNAYSMGSIPTNSAVFGSLMNVDYNVQGNMTSPYSTNLNSAGNYGNVWLLGASNPNLDRYDDGFKIKSITVNTALPEPGTWAMMLLGFGAAGVAMRRSRRAALAVA